MRERACLLSGIRPGGMGEGLLQQPSLLELVLQHLFYAAAVAIYQLLGGAPHLHPTPAPLLVTAEETRQQVLSKQQPKVTLPLSECRGSKTLHVVLNICSVVAQSGLSCWPLHLKSCPHCKINN